MSDENGWQRPDPTPEPPPYPGLPPHAAPAPPSAFGQHPYAAPHDPWQSAPPRRMSTGRRALVVGGVLLAVVGLGAVAVAGVRAMSAFGTAVASGDPFGEAPSGSGEVAYPGELAVGDCYRMRPEDRVAETVGLVRVVACSVPHDGEVYAIPLLDFDRYPGEDAISSSAESSCDERAEAVLDQAVFEDEATYIAWFVPLGEDWVPGPNTASCVVETDTADGLTRSWVTSSRAV